MKKSIVACLLAVLLLTVAAPITAHAAPATGTKTSAGCKPCGPHCKCTTDHAAAAHCPKNCGCAPHGMKGCKPHAMAGCKHCSPHCKCTTNRAAAAHCAAHSGKCCTCRMKPHAMNGCKPCGPHCKCTTDHAAAAHCPKTCGCKPAAHAPSTRK